LPKPLIPMNEQDRGLIGLVQAIVARDARKVASLLAHSPALATSAFAVGATRASAAPYYVTAIEAYICEGDTALHVAAAAYDKAAIRVLVARGANVAAKNRLGGEPLHAAAHGGPTFHTWNPRAQEATILALVEAGADPNSVDKRGVAPLHVAVRTRCTGAVRALLASGANPRKKNGSGSTPMDLATSTTGRGGTGTPAAKKEQAAIVRLLNGQS